MWVGTVSFATIQAYLHGLATGLRYAGMEYTPDEYISAAESRGWDPGGSIGILRDVKRRGLSDEEMVRELIAVESDAYSRMLTRLERQKN